jgi:cell division septal protein FtsQ
MSETVAPVPMVRSWRDIPQPVKPRAMSSGGRWRRTWQGLRIAGAVVLVAGLAAGGWFVAAALGPTPRRVPEFAGAAPVRRVELHTSAGGVLDRAWLDRALELPPAVSLMELELEKLRNRLLRDRQVASATITRQFPDRLIVRITERVPVARLRVELGGAPRDLLVAPDGVVFEGTGFEAGLLASLPWLSGLLLVPDGAGFQPVAGMTAVTQLLADAQLSAQRLYQTWLTVSLSRLASDRELEVTTKNGTAIVFGATGDYFVQLATLDFLLEKLSATPMARARIDLTLGRNVPVLIERATAPAGPAPVAAPAPVPAPVPAPLLSLDSLLPR